MDSPFWTGLFSFLGQAAPFAVLAFLLVAAIWLGSKIVEVVKINQETVRIKTEAEKEANASRATVEYNKAVAETARLTKEEIRNIARQTTDDQTGASLLALLEGQQIEARARATETGEERASEERIIQAGAMATDRIVKVFEELIVAFAEVNGDPPTLEGISIALRNAAARLKAMPGGAGVSSEVSKTADKVDEAIEKNGV